MTMTSQVGNGNLDDDVTIKIGALTDAQLAALDRIPESKSEIPFPLREALHRLTPSLPSPLAHIEAEVAQGGLVTAYRDSGPLSSVARRRLEGICSWRGEALRIFLDAIRPLVVEARRWAMRLGGLIAAFGTRWPLKARRQGLIGWTQGLRERWEVLRALSFARGRPSGRDWFRYWASVIGR